MAKGLNKDMQVNLRFTSDSTQVDKDLKRLDAQLKELMTGAKVSGNFPLTTEIKNATLAAADLRTNLQSAINQDTGKLDLSKFIESMHKGGMTLREYQQQLSALGPEGERAFAALARSITMAEIPLRRQSQLAKELWNTLGNTIRWQATSSAIHAVMGAVQGAYNYAKDLNKELNNIRIVTQKSADHMADFAVEANKAAKGLSTTTKEYLEASLIYFQQGLGEADVKERTETTIKLANVSRESAEEVSQQMTAIWNNFDDGSKSLEYYADVLTALGASTASSTAEISTGLEKFAAVAETVGLSYEYAAAALATVTATTRQSADIVGTAFKTLFARIESLKLGDTLEDGTTLGKYSQALAAVGVSIKDANGELKDMDDILDETAAKWEQLDKDQQVALAQTVAGVRQYTQFIALMDNWDFMEKNLQTAKNAEGTLQRQAEIYAQSWEAAAKRVQTAMQSIYGQLIDDKFFIQLNNSLADALESLNKFIKNIGGLRSVLAGLGAFITSVFQKQISESLGRIGYSMMMSTKIGRDRMNKTRIEAIDLQKEQVNDGSLHGSVNADILKSSFDLQKQYIDNAHKMTAAERQTTEQLFDQRDALVFEVKQRAKALELAEKEAQKKKNRSEYGESGFELGRAAGNTEVMRAHLTKPMADFNGTTQQIKDLQIALEKIQAGYENLGFTTKEYFGDSANQWETFLQAVKKGDPTEITEAWKNFAKTADTSVEKLKNQLKNLPPAQREAIEAAIEQGQAEGNLAASSGRLATMIDFLRERMEAQKVTTIQLSEVLTRAASTISSMAMTVNMLRNIQQTWKDDSVATNEKILTIMTSVGMIIPMLINIVKNIIPTLTKAVITLGTTTKIYAWEIYVIIGLIIGAFALLKWHHDNFSPEGKYKKATKELEDLKTAADDAANALNSLTSTSKGYDDLIQQLKDAKQGTEEWDAAAKGLRDTLFQLYTEYPEIMAEAEFETVNGVTVIKNLDAILAKMQEKTNKANQQVYLQDIETQRLAPLKNNADYKDILDKSIFNVSYQDADSVKRAIAANSTRFASNPEQFDEILNEILNDRTIAPAGDPNLTKVIKDYYSNLANRNQLLETGKKNILANKTENGLYTTLASEFLGEGASQGQLDVASDFISKIYDQWLAEAKEEGGKENFQDILFEHFNNFFSTWNVSSDKNPVIEAFEKQETEIKEKLADINQLSKLVSNENATAEEYAGLNVDWSQLGVNNAIDFIGLSDAEQQQRIVNVQNQLQEALFGATQATIDKMDAEEQAAAQEQLNIDLALYHKKAVGQLCDTYNLDEKELESLTNYYEKYAVQNKNVANSLQGNKQAALEIAAAHLRLKRGVYELSSNWEDYDKILQANDTTSIAYQQTLEGIREHLADILNINEQDISYDFIAENLDLIKDAATGTIGALDKLHEAAGKEYLISIKSEINDSYVNSELESLHNHLVDFMANNELEIGTDLDNRQFINKCNELLATGKWTAEQANEYFKRMGYNAKIITRYKTEVTYDTQEGEFWLPPQLGGPQKIKKKIKKVNKIAVPVVQALTYDGPSGGVISTQDYGDKGGSGSGGGSQSQEKTKDDEIERYHVVREQIRDLTAEYDKVNKSKDRLFGNNRIKAIESEIAITDKLIGKQKEYINEIKDYLGKDSDKLAAGIFDYTGITANIVDGVLINYEEVMDAAVDKLKGDKSEKAEENYEKFKKLISTYEETFKLLDDAEAELTDLVNRNQDATFEKLNYKVELRLDINKRDLRELENDIMLLGDSVYKATERLDILWSEEEGLRDKFDNVNDAVNVQADKLEQLNYTFEHGLISEAQYTEGLQAVGDALQDNLKTLIDYDDEMRTYYSTTLSSANDEMAFWTKQLEHSTTVLEHYQKILELSGHSGDYAMMGVLLKGQVLTRQNSYQASAQWLNVLKDQRAQVEDEMRRAQHRVDGYKEGGPEYQAAMQEVEWLRDKYNSIIEETNNAEEQMLSDFESYLEAMNADLENDITKINKQYEMLATNGLGFDYIKSDLEELSTIQEEYLTKTNQVYETTKFLRQIQNDMDKTDSVAQKSRLQNHIKIVEGLKEQGQLSKVQLEIEKRRYEVELAQMALEDAKNAKSVVRLSRDSEGNYGYVYSADPNKQNDAEQALADKQNDLYNYALETYNTNIGKLNDLYQEQQEKLTALEQEYSEKNLLNSEEYNNKRNEIIKRYEDEAFIYIQNITDARNALNETALTDYTEAYASHYENIITTIDQWRQLTNENITAVHDRYKEWSDTVGNEVRDVVGESLTDIKDRTKEVTSASNELANTIQTQVLPKLQSEVQRVNDVTEAYEQQRRSILSLIEAMRQMMSYTNSQLNTMSTSASFDKSTDYYDLQREAAKRGLITSTSDSLYQASTNAREAKISWLQTGGADVQAYLKSIDYKGTVNKFYNHSGTEATEIFARDLANGVFNSIVTKYKDLDNDELLRRLKGLSTGGYTGSWGNDDGRLALLHEKELVLNEADTQNILNAVDFVRELASSIDLHALSAAAGLGYLSVPGLGGAGQGTLDQNVHIEASFPSVTDHNEIEEALNNLVNRAAQYAGRR